MIKRTYYGWYDARDEEFCISRVPPDCPVRPALRIKSMAEVVDLKQRKKCEILWHPPLPNHLAQHL